MRPVALLTWERRRYGATGQRRRRGVTTVFEQQRAADGSFVRDRRGRVVVREARAKILPFRQRAR